MGGLLTSYAAAVALNFSDASTRYLTLTGDCSLSFTNLAAGRRLSVLVAASGATRVLTLPAGLGYAGTKFTNASQQMTLAAGSRWWLTFEATDATTSGVVVATQPIVN